MSTFHGLTPSTPQFSAFEDLQPLPINVKNIQLTPSGDGLTFHAKSAISVTDPVTRREKKFQLVYDDIKLIDGSLEKTEDYVREKILHANENLQAVILLGLTHFTPGGTTKKIQFKSDLISVVKATNRVKSYGQEARDVIPIRQLEINSKYQIWNTLNAINQLDEELIPQPLHPIKKKLPDGPITRDEQVLINQFLFIDSKWYRYNGNYWVDLKTNKGAMRPLPPFVGVKGREKAITREELERIPAKIAKWQKKYEALHAAVEINHKLFPSTWVSSKKSEPVISELPPPKPPVAVASDPNGQEVEEPETDLAEKAVDITEMKRAGIEAFEEGRYEDAYEHLKGALDPNHPLYNDPDCLYYLAQLFAEGKGGVKQDLKRAKELLKKAQELTGSSELQKKAELREHTLRIKELTADFSIDGTSYSMRHLILNATFLENIDTAKYSHRVKLEMIARAEKNIREKKEALEKLHKLAKSLPDDDDITRLLAIAHDRVLEHREIERINALYLSEMNGGAMARKRA